MSSVKIGLLTRRNNDLKGLGVLLVMLIKKSYHSDTDGIIKLMHDNTDNCRSQEKHNKRVFKLQRKNKHISVIP